MRRKSRKSEPENKGGSTGSSESDENHANGAENEDATSDAGEREPKRRKSDKKTEKTPKKAAKNEKKPAKEKSDDEKDSDEEEQYEVEAIVDSKTVRGSKHYLIRWKGYDASSDTWEAADSLNCAELIKEFNEKKGPESPKKAKRGKKGKSEKAGDAEEEYDENAEYEVDKIIEVHHKRSGKKEFLVSWKGYPHSADSWVDEEDMDCKDLINRFMTKVAAAKNSLPKELRENRTQTDRFTLVTNETGRRLSRRNKGKQRVQYHNAE